MKSLRFFILLSFLIGTLLIIFDAQITGNVIGYPNLGFDLVGFLGFVFIMSSLVLFVFNKGLEAIVIPTGSLEADKERTARAVSEYYSPSSNRQPKYILISGVMPRDEDGRPVKNSQVANIYRELRQKYNISPKDMIIEGKSKDTLENFLFTLKKIKGKNIFQLDISTDSWQFKRFKYYLEKAKEEGIIDQNFEIKLLDTGVVRPSVFYGINSYLKDKGKISEAGSLENADKLGRGSKNERLRWVLKGLIS